MACTNVACWICEAEARNAREWAATVDFALDVRFELAEHGHGSVVAGELQSWRADDFARLYRLDNLAASVTAIAGEG